jgi:hypothetical protein
MMSAVWFTGFVAVRILVAILIALAVAWIGFTVLRAVGGSPARGSVRPEDSEDVADLSVFFVCKECGTEFQVTRLGEVQVPRHCGERMDVVRRSVPGNDPSLN